MEDLELKDILQIFKRRYIYIILITLIVTILGTIYIVFIEKSVYMSTTTMVLSAADGVNEDKKNAKITQEDMLLNQKLVSTYSEIIKSKKIAVQVIDILKLSIKPDDLINMITVSSKKDTEMLEINVLNGDPKTAADIANCVSQIFAEEIVDIYNIKNISIIDEAEVSTEPYNVEIFKQILIALVIGLFSSLGIVILIHYLDTSVKDSEEIEKRLGLPVIAVIPLIDEGR